MGIKPSKKWKRMLSIYYYFAGEYDLDFSTDAATEQYLWESQGIGNLKLGLFQSTNGYAIGKHWMDVTVAMWKEDIKRGLLYQYELFDDPELMEFHWWLNKVFKNKLSF